MSRKVVFAIGGVIVGLIVLAWLPWYITVLIIAAAIAIPTVSYLALDPSQRRKVRSRGRGQIR